MSVGVFLLVALAGCDPTFAIGNVTVNVCDSVGGDDINGWTPYDSTDIYIEREYEDNVALLLHELGHTLGYRHENGSVMTTDWSDSDYYVCGLHPTTVEIASQFDAFDTRTALVGCRTVYYGRLPYGPDGRYGPPWSYAR